MTKRTDLIARLEAMTTSHPDFVPAYHFLSALYGRDGRIEEALRARARKVRLMRGATASP